MVRKPYVLFYSRESDPVGEYYICKPVFVHPRRLSLLLLNNNFPNMILCMGSKGGREAIALTSVVSLWSRFDSQAGHFMWVEFVSSTEKNSQARSKAAALPAQYELKNGLPRNSTKLQIRKSYQFCLPIALRNHSSPIVLVRKRISTLAPFILNRKHDI